MFVSSSGKKLGSRFDQIVTELEQCKWGRSGNWLVAGWYKSLVCRTETMRTASQLMKNMAMELKSWHIDINGGHPQQHAVLKAQN